MQSFYQGKWALVTGATSGIGLALCRELARMGANLVLVARSRGRLEQTRESLLSLSSLDSQIIRILVLDIAKRAAVESAIDALEQDIDLLFNNAGVVCCDLFERLSPEDFVQMMDTNFFGQLWVTQPILRRMRACASGHIVTIASMTGVIGLSGYTAYGASKFALVGFSEALRNELAGGPVRLTLVLPSDVDTAQFRLETKTKPAANKALSAAIPPLTAQQVAMRILRAVRAGRRELVVSPPSGVISLWLYRRFPGISRSVMDWVASRYRQ